MRSERLLVWLKAKYMGDAIMATPLLRALAREFHNPYVLAAPQLEVLLKEDSQGLEFGHAGAGRAVKDILAEAKKLRQRRFHAALIVNRSFGSALTAWLAGIPQRYGHATEGRGLLLTRRIPYVENQHESERCNDLGRLIGIQDFEPIRLTLTAEERQEGARLAQDSEILVQPGASHEGKRIPTRVLVQVVRALQAQGRRVVFLGGKEEARFGAEVQADLERPVLNLIGKTSIRESLAIVSHLKAALGATSGLMHMAVSVGCPTVQVFGKDNPRQWGHPPPHQNVQVANGDMQDAAPGPMLEALEKALVDRSAVTDDTRSPRLRTG